MNYLLVALGGAIGSVLRYGVSRMMIGFAPAAMLAFPWATLTVNVIGGFLIGVCVNTLPREHYLGYLLVTGLLGGFTTFSAFSLETVSLLRSHHYIYALGYVALSLFLSFAAVIIGMQVKSHG